MASAIALRLHSGRFSRDFGFGGINLLLNYEEGCRSDCGYCGLARGRPGGHAEKSFIRVAWPLVRTDELVTRLARFEPALTRLCISMVTHGLAYRDTCDITRRVRARVGTPISVLVAPPAIKRERLENLKNAGVDMIGVGLDAVTEDLFRAIRTDVPAGGLSWDRYWEVIGDAREIFGAWKVNVHTLVGLGETDEDLLTLFVALRDRQVFSYLFCFNPEPDSRCAAWPQPPLARWHRVQLARYLIEARGFGLEQFDFDDEGGIARIRAAPLGSRRRRGRGHRLHDGRLPERQRWAGVHEALRLLPARGAVPRLPLCPDARRPGRDPPAAGIGRPDQMNTKEVA